MGQHPAANPAALRNNKLSSASAGIEIDSVLPSPHPTRPAHTRLLQQSPWMGALTGCLALIGFVGMANRTATRRSAQKNHKLSAGHRQALVAPSTANLQIASGQTQTSTREKGTRVQRSAMVEPDVLQQVIAHSDYLPAVAAGAESFVSDLPALPPQTMDLPSHIFQELLVLLGPPQAAHAADATSTLQNTWSSVSNFFFDSRLQWDENGNILLDPQGNPLPDNLWTQFVAFQATLIERLEQGLRGVGVPGSLGWAVAAYTLMIRTGLYPFVKGQLETTAKIQVLAPRVKEIREKYKDDEERLQQEVGLLYMDLQIDPLGAVLPLLVQLPVFWGLYRAIRRLAIVEYAPLKEGWLSMPSLYGPNFQPDPSFNWILQWQGPLIDLHPKMGWHDFGLYAILPVSIFFAYKQVLAEASEDKDSPKILQLFPFLLSFITVELPQAMGIYIATNIASSVALTAYTKQQISSKIPGYDEFVKTGKWPPGVDPEKVLAKAFGVRRLSAEGLDDLEDPISIPEAVFAGRADFIPTLLEQGRKIDEFDDRGIPASAYTLALNNADLLLRLIELGADPKVVDKRGNGLLHYAGGYGRSDFVQVVLEQGGKAMLNHTNEDGQTPLDVARMNLSQEKVAGDVREVITILVEAGAEGKTTTQEDEARFEEARERTKKEKSLKAARSALMALAAQKGPTAEEGTGDATEDAASHQDDGTQGTAQTAEASAPQANSEIAASLNRVQSLDIESIKARLGGKVSEEQLEKISVRLASMSPEELQAYAAGLPPANIREMPKLQKAEPEPPKKPEEKKQSLIVD